MKCYKCSSQMKRKALDGVLVDSCPVCEGIWLDGGELEMLQAGESKPTEELLMEAKREIKVERGRLVTTSGTCPRCQHDALHQTMVAGTVLDVCSSCSGMYFDWNELTKVLRGTESKGFGGFIEKIRGLLPGSE